LVARGLVARPRALATAKETDGVTATGLAMLRLALMSRSAARKTLH
jgi:hypothetical protein